MTEPLSDPIAEPLPLVTAPPVPYRLDLLARKIREGGFPEFAARLDKRLPSEVMWEVADECLNTLLWDRAAAAAMYAARLRHELSIPQNTPANPSYPLAQSHEYKLRD